MLIDKNGILEEDKEQAVRILNSIRNGKKSVCVADALFC